jgi:peptidoglycan DL-endopeptidase CwlO
MPSALVAALAAPIREVQSLVGPGWSSPAEEPAAALGRVRDALADVSAAARRAWTHAEASWFGAGADAAAQFAATTVAEAEALAARVDQLGATAQTAAAAVSRAGERLRAIVEDFEARAAALEPYLESPGAAEGLLAEARRSLAEAVAVVDELRAELDGHAATLTSPSAASPAATTPAGFVSPSTPSMPSMGSGFGGAPISPPSGMGGTFGSGLADLAKFSPPDAPLPDAATFGDGFAVRLPDGSTAMAPNAVAASAVRHALTQLGVPYDWGGTTPGVGLDCSGLTQWAYREAGLEIRAWRRNRTSVPRSIPVRYGLVTWRCGTDMSR